MSIDGSYPEPVVEKAPFLVRVLIGLVCVAFCVGFYVGSVYLALHLWDKLGLIDRGALTTTVKVAFTLMVLGLVSSFLLVCIKALVGKELDEDEAQTRRRRRPF